MKLEVHHIRARKGKRQLTELNVQSPDHAAAARTAGIDIIVSGWRPDFPARRAAAMDTHFCFGLIYGHHVIADEAKKPPLTQWRRGRIRSIARCIST